MKKYILLFAVVFLAVACKTEQEKALKSADKNYILKVANEKFAKKKWRDALALYDRLPNLVAGTDDAPNVVFNSAYANYYDKNYKLAGYQFKNFAVTFPQDPRREEAAYMSALCYYEGSQDYNLDQTNTESAINELQDFINNYPNSERSKNINQLIEELSYKLEFKAFENARQYYKMGDYKAANVVFENFLNDFPATKQKAKAVEYILKSKYELAMKSRFDLKQERLLNTIAYTKQVEREFPNTDNAKLAVDFRGKLTDELKRFEVLKKEVEARNAELTAKQKAEEAKIAAKEKEREQSKKHDKEVKDAQKAQRDSAKISTPEPAATFKIGK